MKKEILLKILAWERSYKHHGDHGSIIELFQDLIDSGDIQHMGDKYMDIASQLIAYGVCYRPELKVVK